MNLILFRSDELETALSRGDPRAVHILDVLGCRTGDRFDAGEINGPMGKAEVLRIEDEAVRLRFDLDTTPPLLNAVRLIPGLPRPQTARDILREAASLGVERISFVQTEKGEKSYAGSRLWKDREYQRLLVRGAETAFTTRLPAVEIFSSLPEALSIRSTETNRVALDNYEAETSLKEHLQSGPAVTRCTLAVGAERGWSDDERNILRNSGFTLVGIGGRVLRTETACIVGLTLVLAAMGVL